MLYQISCTLCLLIASAITAQQPLAKAGPDLSACFSLALKLRELVTFSESPRYTHHADSYWAANQGQLHPTCYVSPRTASDLQIVVDTLHEHLSSFAVRSGGHSSVPSTSNIVDGVSIDLSRLNTISFLAGHQSIRIGSGALWSDVYEAISSCPGYAVPGARAGSVGVGGYLLGGGISIFSSLAGWACDSIESMDVLLPNATIVTASPSSHSSLFTALKGCASNFGIVTSFTLALTDFLSGGTNMLQSFTGQASFDVVVLSYHSSLLPDVVSLLTTIADGASTDPFVSISISLTTQPDLAPLLTVTIESLLKHRTPTILRPFLQLNYIHILYEPMTQSTFGQLVTDSNPSGHCQHKSTFTSHNNASYASLIASSFMGLFNSTSHSHSTDSNFQAAILIQPLTLPHLSFSLSSSKPNVLGLSDEPAPLLLYSFEVRHTYHSDSSTPDTTYPSLLQHFIHSHESNEAAHPFRYVNYASADQDVFAALKRDRKQWAWLQDVKKEYDPEGWWERWNGGGENGPFKIR